MMPSRSSPQADEQVGEQGLQDAEALRRHRPGEALDDIGLAGDDLGRGGRRCAFVRGARGPRALDDEAAELRRLERDGSAVLPEDPAREQVRRCVLRDEGVALDVVPLAAVGALDPPRGIGCDFDLRLADDVAELPLRPAAVVLDVELGRQPEVALPAGREADVGADPRDAERADVVPLEVVADHVPRAVLRQQRERVERALLFLVAVDRPVPELDRALLRDRALQLAEPPCSSGE